VSVEKNLPLLVDAFRQLCRQRNDTALIVAGDGPYLAEMKKKLAGTPAYFLGFQSDKQLGPLYAGSDLFVFPSRTDTLGQDVMEAQASGMPVLVSNECGPKEKMEDTVTGLM
jgi:glycosyltransferase involved in cell wall biosynthesis